MVRNSFRRSTDHKQRVKKEKKAFKLTVLPQAEDKQIHEIRYLPFASA
jgi:hypothetical protein